MSQSVISICNTALSRVSVSQFIEDLGDANDRARLCSLHYDNCRRQVLQEFPWNFARSVVALASLTGAPPPGWLYAYRYPTDCLHARAVSDAAGIRNTPHWQRDFLTWDGWAYQISGKVPWEVMADPDTNGARRVVCDIDDAYLWYTKDVETPEQFTPLFASALAWRLAAEIGPGLRVDARIRQAAEQSYIWAISQAQAASHNESRSDRQPDSPSISVRA